MGKAWIKKTAKDLGLTTDQLRGMPGIGGYITERKIGPNTGYMISEEGVAFAHKRMNPVSAPELVKARIVKRPRNRRLLICRLEGDGMPLAEGSEQSEAIVRVRNNQNWSAGQIIELDSVDKEGLWCLTHRWAQWEKRRKS